jgi:hypothetical protein
MPKYRALGPLFIGSQYIEAGEDFESDLIPGRNWQPLDDAAKAAAEKRGAVVQLPEPHARTVPLAEIPGDWRELSAPKQIALAKKLGAAAKGLTREIAIKQIETEVAHRATVAA